jgi:hypothetical protein
MKRDATPREDGEKAPAPKTPATEIQATEPEPDPLLRPGALESVDLASRLGLQAWTTARDASGFIRANYSEHGAKEIAELYKLAAALGTALSAAITWDFPNLEIEHLFEAGDKLAAFARGFEAIEVGAHYTDMGYRSQRERLVALAAAGIDWQLQAQRFRGRLEEQGDSTGGDAHGA